MRWERGSEKEDCRVKRERTREGIEGERLKTESGERRDIGREERQIGKESESGGGGGSKRGNERVERRYRERHRKTRAAVRQPTDSTADQAMIALLHTDIGVTRVL